MRFTEFTPASPRTSRRQFLQIVGSVGAGMTLGIHIPVPLQPKRRLMPLLHPTPSFASVRTMLSLSSLNTWKWGKEP